MLARQAYNLSAIRHLFGSDLVAIWGGMSFGTILGPNCDFDTKEVQIRQITANKGQITANKVQN